MKQTNPFVPWGSAKPCRLCARLPISCLLAFAISLPLVPRADPFKEAVFSADFTDPPVVEDWISKGDPSLFAWSEADKALAVTWDSSRTNSFFLHPLGTTLTAGDDFSLSFSIQMVDIAPGVDPAKPYTFQMALGFVNMTQAFRPDFFRGSGINGVTGPRSVIEWDYFPDTGFGATISPAIFATNNAVRTSFTFPFELESAVVYDVFLNYTEADRTLRTRMLADGQPTQDIQAVPLPAAESFDFRLDALGVMSFSDAGQSKGFEGSILAHGFLRSLEARYPGSLRIALDAEIPGRVLFHARKNWRYELERSGDLLGWQPSASVTAGSNADASLTDPAAGPSAAFYRVKATLP